MSVKTQMAKGKTNARTSTGGMAPTKSYAEIMKTIEKPEKKLVFRLLTLDISKSTKTSSTEHECCDESVVGRKMRKSKYLERNLERRKRTSGTLSRQL